MKQERNIKSAGIILSSRRAGELHRGVTLFTPDLGLVSAMAFGARKGKSKLSGWVEPFVSGTFLLYCNPVKDQYKILDIDEPRFREFLREDIYSYYLASFWAELIIKSYCGGGEQARLFPFLLDAMDALEEACPERADADHRLLVQFLWRFFTLIGDLPDLHQCGACGTSLVSGSAYRETGAPSFLCPRCSNGGEELSLGSIRYLLATLSLPIKEALKVQLAREALESLRRISLSLASEVIDAPLKTIQAGIL